MNVSKGHLTGQFLWVRGDTCIDESWKVQSQQLVMCAYIARSCSGARLWLVLRLNQTPKSWPSLKIGESDNLDWFKFTPVPNRPIRQRELGVSKKLQLPRVCFSLVKACPPSQGGHRRWSIRPLDSLCFMPWRAGGGMCLLPTTKDTSQNHEDLGRCSVPSCSPPGLYRLIPHTPANCFYRNYFILFWVIFPLGREPFTIRSRWL